MNPQLLPATPRDDAAGWERTLYAFLAEKERPSGSRRTVESYARMLWPFFGRVGSARARDAASRPCLGPWHRRLGAGAVIRDRRRPDRLPQQLLPLPHPSCRIFRRLE